MQTNETRDILEVPATPCGARWMPMSGQCEIDVSLSPEAETACCGEVLRPFWAEDGRFMAACSRCGQKYSDRTQVRFKASPWIGVDLDGTLAHDLGMNGRKTGLGEIGAPVIPMLKRLKGWIAAGMTVKIFTARASSPKQVALIKNWLARYGLPDLEVTNVKDLHMIELWDDRCVQVMTNQGEPVMTTVTDQGVQHVPRLRPGNRVELSQILSRLRIFLAV